MNVNLLHDEKPDMNSSFVYNDFFAIGACASKPCQNGGECVDDGQGGYQCKCTPNWEGKDCELPKCKFKYFSTRQEQLLRARGKNTEC